MSRYIGPRVKKLRALGVDLPGLSRKSHERRPQAPGQHGAKRKRKVSDFGRQLAEKQKLRFNYGVGERQFRRLVLESRKSKMGAGDKLLELLERRLDNVVFRAGLAATIPAARQLVSHGHITVNGRRVNIPSYRVHVGDVIRPKDSSLQLHAVHASLGSPALSTPDWLEVDKSKLLTRVSALPDKAAIPFAIDIQLVIEHYSKRI
jgi:small subunit ribosomal protein S4